MAQHESGNLRIAPHPGAEAGLRIAIVSTPRCGNTWLRHLLASSYGLTQLAAHRPGEVAWQSLPERAVLQIHWHPTEPFLALLAQYGFRVVVLARHPLDALISLLNWVVTCPYPRSVWKDNPCLDGDRGNECSLIDADPLSPAFVDYACSRRAEALLSVSRRWWSMPGALTLAYERLVDDPLAQLARLARGLSAEAQLPFHQAVAGHTMEKLRRQNPDCQQHFWQGRPGLWKSLLTADVALEIAAAQWTTFVDLGYECDADRHLHPHQARANWTRLHAQAA